MPERPRDAIQRSFNRGLSFVRPRGKIGNGQAQVADNVIFTKDALERRAGIAVAYRPDNPTDTGPVTLLKRFYDLATTGTIAKFFLKAYGSSIAIMPDTTAVWSDDTATAITATWPVISLPATTTTPDTLYTLYDSPNTAVTVTSGAIKHAVQSHSWLYIYPDYASGDDNSRVTNVPFRTNGTQCFIHGLVPPAALVTADTQNGAPPPEASWTFLPVGNGQIEAGGRIVAHTDGTIHGVYIEVTTRHPWYFKRTPAGITTAERINGDVVAAGAISEHMIDIAVDTDGNPHVVYADDAGLSYDYKYTTRTTSWSGAFSVFTEVGAGVGTAGCSIAMDEFDRPHIVYRKIGAGDLASKYEIAVGIWSAESVIDTTGDTGQFPEMVRALDGSLHVVYVNVTAPNIRYARNTATGGWQPAETVAAGVNNYPSIATDSASVPHVAITLTTTRYTNRTGGTWAALTNIDATTGDNRLSIAIDSSDIPVVVYGTAGGGGSTLRLGRLTGGTWSTSQINTVMAGDATGLVASGGSTPQFFVFAGSLLGVVNNTWYHYKLTAEYDGGALGESGPSASFQAFFGPISTTNTHTLDLQDAAFRYDMAADVTRIYVYRTTANATATSTYYRVGSVTCTDGAPTGDFVDNVADLNLVANKILNPDVFLPPKYKTAVYWKDRLVIGNLKARKRDAAEGTELDLHDGGIHKNKIRFSRAFKPDSFPANYFLDVIPDGESGSIQKLIVSPTTDALICFLEGDIVAITGDSPLGDVGSAFRPRNIGANLGTPAPDSVVEADGLIFFWTKTGISVLNGLSVRDITANTISPLWNFQFGGSHPQFTNRINMSQMASVRGVYHRDNLGRRILWAYAAGTSTTNSRVLVLDLDRWMEGGYQDGVFSIFSGTGWAINVWESWRGEGDRGELFASPSSTTIRTWVHRALFGNEDEVGSTGTSITFQAISSAYKTHLDEFGRPDLLKRFKSLRIEMTSTNSLASITANIDDDNFTASLGTFNFNGAGVNRLPSAIPRQAIGVRAGLDFTIVDTLTGNDGPVKWTLYDVAWRFTPMTTRVIA